MQINTFSSFVLLLELVALATAAPSAVQKRSFKVERVRNDGFTGRNGPRALAKVYRKFGMPLPPGLVDAAEAQDATNLDPTTLTKRRAGKWQPPVGLGVESTGATSASASAGFNAEQSGGESEGNGILGDLLGGANGLLGNAEGNENGAGNGRGGKGKGNGQGQGQGQGQNIGQGQGQGQGQNNGQGQGQNIGQGQGQGQGQNNGQGNGQQQNEGGVTAEEARKDVIAALNKAREGNQTGSVPAVPEPNDTEYLSQVKIGGQPVTLDFDTGSSDLWVFNTQLSAQQIAGRPVYDPAKSTTFQEMPGAEFEIRYGDGSGAKGNVGTDVVEVGGAVVAKQAVEMAQAVTDTFVRDTNNGGLMGLAFGNINAVKPQKQKTFFENVMGSLSEPVFTADLRAGAAGAYEFGRIDSAKFTGDMAWIPVDASKGFWQFSSESFAVNGGQPQQATQGGQAIADTGTTLILADPAIVKGYYEQVPQAQEDPQAKGFTFPCNSKLPDLDLDIGGQYMARIKGDDINFAPLGNGGTCNFFLFSFSV